MEIEKSKEFEHEYNSLKPNLDRFREAIVVQIKELIDIENIPLGFPIQNRTKTWISILEKIRSGRYNIKKSVEELQDLVGLRIILLFNRDVENVCNLLKDNLNILKQYNTTERLKEDQFGYSSIHLIASIPNEWQSVPTFKGLDKYTVEIQVRTLSQHTWSEASKELKYKQEQNVPRPLLRSIGRVSALLETVDLEFERLLMEREQYKQNLHIELTESENTELNVDNLEAILDKHLPAISKESDELYSDNLQELLHFKINTINKLEEFIKKNLPKALEADKLIVKKIKQSQNNPETLSGMIYAYDENRTNTGVFYSHSGLLREMFAIAFPKDWEKYKENKWKN